MQLHANVKVGLSGRLRARLGDRGRSLAEGGRSRLQRLAGDVVYAGIGSRGFRAYSSRLAAAASGRAQERCCTSTSSGSPASASRATAPLATGASCPGNHGVGYEYLHRVVDDHSRYAYVELHPREDGLSAARVLPELASLGLPPPEAVMTDNAFAYTRSRRFREIFKKTTQMCPLRFVPECEARLFSSRTTPYRLTLESGPSAPRFDGLAGTSR
jgi:hypothetical protein